jgi:hypothetical protein
MDDFDCDGSRNFPKFLTAFGAAMVAGVVALIASLRPRQ